MDIPDWLSDQPAHFPVSSSEVVYTGRVWNIRRDHVQYADSMLVREYVDHPGAVAVVALNPAGEVMLIRQYRHPSRLHEWEIPAGLLDLDGENPLEAAQRELAEEVDLRADRWHLLIDLLNSPGGMSEATRVFLARDLSDTPEPFAREGEEADMHRRWVDLDLAVAAVLDRRVQNGPLCAALLATAAARDRGFRTLGNPDAPWPGHPRWR